MPAWDVNLFGWVNSPVTDPERLIILFPLKACLPAVLFKKRYVVCSDPVIFLFCFLENIL